MTGPASWRQAASLKRKSREGKEPAPQCVRAKCNDNTRRGSTWKRASSYLEFYNNHVIHQLAIETRVVQAEAEGPVEYTVLDKPGRDGKRVSDYEADS